MKTLVSFWKLLVALMLVAHGPSAAAADGVALVTAIEGKVGRVAAGGGKSLQAFEKLMPGDRLALEGNARIRIVFFASQRQESWQGSGRIEIGNARATGTGIADPEVKVLPEIMVRQIAKTPSIDNQGRAGAVRLRSITAAGDLAKLENDYQRLRAEAPADDITPEIFLLAALFEKGEFARIEKLLGELGAAHAGKAEVAGLQSLYRQAIASKQQSPAQ